MACRQCTRPFPARVAISRIKKAWLREARLWVGSGLRPLYIIVTGTRTRGTPVLHARSSEPKFTTRTRMYSLTIEKKLEAHGSSVL